MLSFWLVVVKFVLVVMGSFFGDIGSHTDIVVIHITDIVLDVHGLDPRTTAAMFAESKCVGEKKVNGDDCFILKLCADPETLRARNEGAAEIVRHTFWLLQPKNETFSSKMEEKWTIKEVAFNVLGLSVDCFIPLADLRSGSLTKTCEYSEQEEKGKSSIPLASTVHRAKVAALEKGSFNKNSVWHIDV